jgi:hypothetical protein
MTTNGPVLAFGLVGLTEPPVGAGDLDFAPDTRPPGDRS